MNILAIETSTDQGSLAFFERGELMWSSEVESGRNHNTEVLVELERLFSGDSAKPDLILVGAGPGNYTGVRVAISITQGLQAVWGCKSVMLPSFLTALAVEEIETPVIFGNARRREFYQAVIDADYRMSPIAIIKEDEVDAFLNDKKGQCLVYFEKSAVMNDKMACMEAWYHQPKACELVDVWMKMSEENQQYYLKKNDNLEPIYLRPPNMQKSQKNHPLLSI